MSKGIERLKTVMPANQKAMVKASRSGDIPNISTEQCAETPAFNTHSLEGAFRDQAGMSAEHLNLAAHAVQHGQQELRQFRQSAEQQTTQLRELRLPDTRVNLDGIKIEIPFEIKQYAIDIDQDKYMKIMWSLLGKDRIASFRQHSTKANQNTTPALWLNQMIAVETKKPYVFMISQKLDQLTSGWDEAERENLLNVDPGTAQAASDYLEMTLGYTLRAMLNSIAQSNQLPLFVIFVIIVDEILNRHTEVNIPSTPSSLWEDPFAPAEESK